MPETAWYEALFSQICTVFSVGHIVYTEDVGGSSPSSPTIFSNYLVPYLRSSLKVHQTSDLQGRRQPAQVSWAVASINAVGHRGV